MELSGTAKSFPCRISMPLIDQIKVLIAHFIAEVFLCYTVHYRLGTANAGTRKDFIITFLNSERDHLNGL